MLLGLRTFWLTLCPFPTVPGLTLDQRFGVWIYGFRSTYRTLWYRHCSPRLNTSPYRVSFPSSGITIPNPLYDLTPAMVCEGWGGAGVV